MFGMSRGPESGMGWFRKKKPGEEAAPEANKIGSYVHGETDLQTDDRFNVKDPGDQMEDIEDSLGGGGKEAMSKAAQLNYRDRHEPQARQKGFGIHNVYQDPGKGRRDRPQDRRAGARKLDGFVVEKDGRAHEVGQDVLVEDERKELKSNSFLDKLNERIEAHVGIGGFSLGELQVYGIVDKDRKYAERIGRTLDTLAHIHTEGWGEVREIINEGIRGLLKEAQGNPELSEKRTKEFIHRFLNVFEAYPHMDIEQAKWEAKDTVQKLIAAMTRTEKQYKEVLENGKRAA